MSPTDLVKALHVELWADGDRSALDRYVASDARTVMTGFEGSTIDVMREDVDRYFGAFSDVTTEIVDMLSEGDQVAMWWRTTGTHTGPYGEIAPQPTGPVITMEGVDLYRVKRDKVTEVRSLWDAAAVYRQFGLLADGL